MLKHKIILLNVSAVFILCVLTGCAGALLKNLGRIEPNPVVTGHFENFTVNNDYNYFLSGSDVYPIAIFGLKKDYVIDSDPDLWISIEPNQKKISELVSNIQRKMLECCLQRPQGFDILDNHGKKIGEWYSMLDLSAAIRMKEDGKVVIYPPSDTASLKRYQDRTDER